MPNTAYPVQAESYIHKTPPLAVTVWVKYNRVQP